MNLFAELYCLFMSVLACHFVCSVYSLRKCGGRRGCLGQHQCDLPVALFKANLQDVLIVQAAFEFSFCFTWS